MQISLGVIRGHSTRFIRESIHAVESIARTMTGADTLAGALQKLEGRVSVHPALKRGFQALYGYTSDEDGIRHALLEKSAAKVDLAVLPPLVIDVNNRSAVKGRLTGHSSANRMSLREKRRRWN